MDRAFSRVDETIAMAAVYAANHLERVAGMVCLTESGTTALRMSRLSSGLPIYALSRHPEIVRRMCLYRGVRPILFDYTVCAAGEVAQEAVNELLRRGLVGSGERLILTRGALLGETLDALAVATWGAVRSPGARVWFAGFSFGAWIGMQLLMRRPEITGFVSVSPDASRYDFSFLAPCPSSGLIINGSADRIAPPKDTQSLVNKLHEQKGITITHTEIEGADHFFKDEEAHMQPMIQTVSDYVRRRMTEATR